MHLRQPDQRIRMNETLPPPTGAPVGAILTPVNSSAAQVLTESRSMRAVADQLLRYPVESAKQAILAYQTELDRAIGEQLFKMPIERLRVATGGSLRLGRVEQAGYTTVSKAWKAAEHGQLRAINGVGEKTERQIIAAASTIEKSLREGTRVRFDVDNRPRSQTALLMSLQAVDNARRHIDPLHDRLQAAVHTLDNCLPQAMLEIQRVRRLFASHRRKTQAAEAVARLRDFLLAPETSALRGDAHRVSAALSSAGPRADVWADYIARSVYYNGLLIELAGTGSDHEAAHGFLPDDIVSRINAQELDTSALAASLRGYQVFGAKFALAQRRTIIGDEMGLGKTIEALAVLCHLHSAGATHFLVVCPNSVTANWQQEIARHTHLESAWLVHGANRNQSLMRWAAQGGIAITTYGTLGTLVLPRARIDALVVDEAHLVKNPDAQRTAAVQRWLRATDLAILMTGTPMENRVSEFKTLVSHVQPEVAGRLNDQAGLGGADSFRRSVANVYLRRNQTDVLEELPAKIEIPEWLHLEGPAASVYRTAVADGNFMMMRRAAFMTPNPMDSPKLARLVEIATEACENDRKVVVFSYFRDVIDRVCDSLGERALEPITGSVVTAKRQQIVDEFSRVERPVVLVAQIETGGVGLNLQAGSVVVLCEPQWKPSIENQAIARCHRMGQVRPVEVHRLFTVNSVDERMVEILAAKSELFADYARESVLRDAAPEAIDISDQKEVKALASQAEQERSIIEQERQRLGLAS